MASAATRPPEPAPGTPPPDVELAKVLRLPRRNAG
jgi:hypothetical protein